MKPKILFITLLLLGFVHLAQGSIPPNGLQASLVLSHGMPLESAGCTTGDESHVSLANEGVTNSGAGCRSIKVARYFTTGLGRWSQPEPLLKGVPPARFLANPQKLNPYSYCLNNPTKYVDPDGKETKIYSVPVVAGHRHLFIVVKNENIYTSKGLYPKNRVAAVKSLIPFLKGGTPEVRTDLKTELGEVKKLDSGGKSNAKYEATISPPSGMTTEQHDKAVIDAADKYPVDKKTYDADQGPNSNTYVDDVIESTGATMPDVPGATQQNYGEEEKKKEEEKKQ